MPIVRSIQNKTKGRDLFVATSPDNGVTWNVIGLAKSCSLDLTCEMKEVASTSGRAKYYKPGRYSWTMAADRVYDADLDDGDNNQTVTLVGALTAGTAVKIRYTQEDGTPELIPGVIYEGMAYVESIRINANVDGYASASVQFRGTGELTPIY